MRIIKTLICVLLLTATVQHSNAQHTEGTFKLELIKITPGPDVDTTSAQYVGTKEMFDKKLKATLAYNKDMLVVSEANQNVRELHNFAKGEVYLFDNNEKTVTISAIDPTQPKRTAFINPSDLPAAARSEPVLVEDYKFGLDCWKHEINGPATMVMMMTTEIATPDIDLEKAKADKTGVLVEMIMKDPTGTELIFGIKDFESKPADKAVFSTDTTGYTVEDNR